MATLVGGVLALGLGAVALAAPPPPDPGQVVPTTSAPEPAGEVDGGDRPDAGPVTQWKDPAPTPGAGKVAVVKWVEGVPAAWPVTVTILDPAATFADGSTTADIVTDPSGEPVELSLVGVPAGGARVRLQEPDRSDATFQDVVCESYGNRYDTVEIERGVELIVPPLAGEAKGESWGHWRPFPVCWFENVASTRVTLASTLDGGAPAGGTAMAVLPETGRVGVGGTFDDDGIFPVGVEPVDVELSGFPAGGPMDVFVGQLTTSGSTISGMRCTVGVSTFTGPLEAREIGDATVVGMILRVARHDEVGCAVDVAAADLQAVKTASIDAARPGATFDYTIVATNAGRAPLFATGMTDVVPSELVVRSVIADEPTTTCTVAGNRVDCDLGDLGAGAVRTVRITVFVQPDVVDASAITNVAIVRGEVPLWIPGLGATDPVGDGPAVAPTADRPPVFAHAVQVLATSVVRAFAPPPIETSPPTTTPSTTPATGAPGPDTAAPTTAPTSAPATSPTTAAPQIDPEAASAETSSTSPAAAAQQGPLPTVTGGPTLPSTGSDLSLLVGAAWTTAVGAVLVAVRRVRRTVRS